MCLEPSWDGPHGTVVTVPWPTTATWHRRVWDRSGMGRGNGTMHGRPNRGAGRGTENITRPGSFSHSECVSYGEKY